MNNPINRVTRRSLLLGGGASLAGMVLLAACSNAAPAPTSAPAATTAPATTAPAATATTAPQPAATAKPAATAAPSSTTAPAATAAPATTAAATAQPATQANPFGPAQKKGGTYTFSAGGAYPHIFVPYSYYGTTEFWVCKMLFTPLFFLDSNWQNLGPALATSWEWSSDNKQLTVHLRKGVKFHDGQELTAKDVDFTIKMMVRKEDYPSVQDITIFQGGKDYKDRKTETFAGLDVLDDYTVRFNLSAPSVVFMLNLSDTGIVPMHAFPADALTSKEDSNGGANTFEFFKTKPIGTGPFKLREVDLKTHITFDSFKDYWKGAPNLDSIIFRLGMASPAVIAGLESGELDGAYVAMQDADTLKSNTSLNQIVNYSMANEQMLMVACEKPYMNVKVRQALLTALDREALIKTVTYGYAKPAPAIIMYPPLFPNPALPSYDYSPAKAKQLLQEGNWDPTRKLIFGQFTTQGAPTNTYAAMINMWKAVGIDVQFLPMDSANSTKIDIANPHIFDVEMESYAWLAYDPTSTYQEMACNVPGNYPHYCNQDYDSTMKEATTTLDPTKSKQLFQKVQTILETDLPYIPVWIEPEIWEINKKMHGGDLARGPLNDIQSELWWKE